MGMLFGSTCSGPGTRPLLGTSVWALLGYAGRRRLSGSATTRLRAFSANFHGELNALGRTM